MPAPRPFLILPLAAMLMLSTVTFLLWTIAPSAAFSQIGNSEKSETPAKQGIVTVPLPPLPGEVAPKAVTEQPASPEKPGAEQPAKPAAAPSLPATNPQPAAKAPKDLPAVPDGAGVPDLAPGATDDAAPPNAVGKTGAVAEPAGPPPEVFYGDQALPAPVRELRAKLIEIAKTGEIEKLRPYIEPGDEGTVLSFAGQDGDPIEFLKGLSGDGDGVELLAILLETLEAGYVHNDANTDNELYVWPYFTGLSIEKLTKPQKVELFELVTAGDYQEMLGFGAYNFYRVGISPDGKLQFFVAGD